MIRLFTGLSIFYGSKVAFDIIYPDEGRLFWNLLAKDSLGLIVSVVILIWLYHRKLHKSAT
jgi:hypothetical protein